MAHEFIAGDVIVTDVLCADVGVVDGGDNYVTEGGLDLVVKLERCQGSRVLTVRFGDHRPGASYDRRRLVMKASDGQVLVGRHSEDHIFVTLPPLEWVEVTLLMS